MNVDISFHIRQTLLVFRRLGMGRVFIYVVIIGFFFSVLFVKIVEHKPVLFSPNAAHAQVVGSSALLK